VFRLVRDPTRTALSSIKSPGRLLAHVDCFRLADNPPGGDGKHYAVTSLLAACGNGTDIARP
jgi:hypothetical protein